MYRVWVARRGKDASPVAPRMRRREWSQETASCRRSPPGTYTEGYLAFPFRRTLSRLREMQLQRFGHGYLSQSR